MYSVSAIVPNYNGTSLLKKFLPDVLRCLITGDELIIVDDASTDESVKFLIKTYKLSVKKITKFPTNVSASYYPKDGKFSYKLYQNTVLVGKNKIKFLLIVLENNLRFAGAVNAAVKFAEGSHILLLNSDVSPEKNIRSYLLTHFADSLVFGVGCLEYESNLNGEKSGKNKLWFEKGMFMHSKAEDMRSGTSAWVSGGSGMFDKNKWVLLDGFDQLFYPAYWEDVDLSFRALKQGWKVLFEPRAVVFHVHESTNIDVFGQQKIMNMSWNNSIKFVKKNANFLQLILHYLFTPYWNYKRKKHLEKNRIVI